MTGPRTIAARLAYRLVAQAPAAAVGRARTAGRVAPLLEAGFAVVGAPLYGAVVPIAHGPAAGLHLLAERRSLAWISGLVEQEVQAVVTRYLRAGGTFVDVGASVGFFSILAARVVGPTGTVVAFEPQPGAAASVRRNVELNGFEIVTVVEAALSSVSGNVLLEGIGKATAHVAGPRSSQRGLRVVGTSLDVFLADRGELAPDLVKIDVEGHEREVLVGMRATLGKHRPVLVIECHGNAGQLLAPLHDAGYTVSVLGSDVRARDAHPSAHLLALPAMQGSS